MTWNLNLLKIIPLITLNIGFLISPNVAEAASSTSHKSSVPHETLTESTHGGAHAQNPTISRLLLSEKAQKIEFFTVLGLIGASVLVPEVVSKSKRKSQKNQSLKSDVAQSSPQTPEVSEVKENNTEPDISYLQSILENTKQLDFGTDNLINLDDHKKNGLKNKNQSDQKAV